MQLTIKGVVVEGKKLGRKLGFPTANIIPKLEIPSGIYAGLVKVDSAYYKAGIYKGKDDDVLEAHLLNFSGNLYGKEIEIEIKEKLRDVLAFKDEDQMKILIQGDIAAIQKIYF